ncbi:MAG: glycosyltransferase [Microgenomates group bacterium]
MWREVLKMLNNKSAVFIGLAPIEFQGGFETWMSAVSKEISQNNDVFIFNLHPILADIYSNLILKRNFSATNKPFISTESLKRYLIDITSLNPFSEKYKSLSRIIKRCEIIYIKFEIVELLILFYFGGMGSIKKSIAGIHSPFAYKQPSSFIQIIHNFIYCSSFTIFILKHFRRIHVVSSHDYEIFTIKYKLTNVNFVRNFSSLENKKNIYRSSKNKIKCLFIGEISLRKGADVLIEFAKFNKVCNLIIIGNGPMSPQLINLSENSSYLGQISHDKLGHYYEETDLLLMLSRDEGFPLTVIEAMSYGIKIIANKELHLELPDFAVKRIKLNSDSLQSAIVSEAKTDGHMRNTSSAKMIFSYFAKTFSKTRILKDIKTIIFKELYV